MEKRLKAYTLFSSSKGNCTYVEYGADRILIDAGVSYRLIASALSALGTDMRDIDAVFVSHEHSDHTKGLQVMSKRCGLPIYTDALCMQLIGVGCPEAQEHLVPVGAGDTVYIGDIKAEIFSTSHDSVRSFCYRITAGNTSLGFATDTGCVSEDVQNAVFGCDGVVIESNYDKVMLQNGPYRDFLKKRIAGKRGHLSNDDCACLAPVLARCGTRSIVLAHLSETNNTSALAYSASSAKLREYGVTIAGETFAADVRLQVAKPNGTVEVMP